MNSSIKKQSRLSNHDKKKIIAKMTKSQNKKQPAQDKLSKSFRSKEISEEYYSFKKNPGYRQLLIQKEASKTLNIDSPFFMQREGVAKSVSNINSKECINFSSYNYLDLCGNETVSGKAIKAINDYGTSVSASRIISGEREFQRVLERNIADNYQVDDCVVFVSGHATNVTVIGCLMGAKDLIVHDSLIHNSVLQGAILSGSSRKSFSHNNWEELDEILRRSRPEYQKVLIVIEGHYGMDGDIPNLPKFLEIKEKYHALLMVDEAHSLGVVGQRGRGLAEYYGIGGDQVDIWMGTLSKTLASAGGYIAGETALVEYLKYYAPGFLYSVGISPPAAASANAALEIMNKEPKRVDRLNSISKYFLDKLQKIGVNTGTSMGFSIIPLIIGDSLAAIRLTNNLLSQGVSAQPIIHPAVDESSARIRFFMNSAHTYEQIDYTLEKIQSTMNEMSLLK